MIKDKYEVIQDLENSLSLDNYSREEVQKIIRVTYLVAYGHGREVGECETRRDVWENG